MDLHSARTKQCSDDKCGCKSALNSIPSKLHKGNFVYGLIDDDVNDGVDRLVNDGHTFDSILSAGGLLIEEGSNDSGSAQTDNNN